MEDNGKYVLVVDDDPSVRGVYCQVLNRMRITNKDFENPEESLQHVMGSSLIITDYSMPKMNGYEFAEKARTMGFERTIIMVTGAHVADERQKFLDMVLTKPVNVKDLACIVLECIDDV